MWLSSLSGSFLGVQGISPSAGSGAAMARGANGASGEACTRPQPYPMPPIKGCPSKVLPSEAFRPASPTGRGSRPGRGRAAPLPVPDTRAPTAAVRGHPWKRSRSSARSTQRGSSSRTAAAATPAVVSDSMFRQGTSGATKGVVAVVSMASAAGGRQKTSRRGDREETRGRLYANVRGPFHSLQSPTQRRECLGTWLGGQLQETRHSATTGMSQCGLDTLAWVLVGT